jgi:hypothetical protein
MKTTLSILLLFASITLNAQLTAHLGDSQAKGLIGVEYRYGSISLNTGYLLMPIREGNRVRYFNSYSGSMTFYSNTSGTSWYFRLAGMSAGTFYFNRDNMQYYSEPAVQGLLGLRFYPHNDIWWWNKRSSLDFGLGVSMAPNDIQVAMECTFNFDITR